MQNKLIPVCKFYENVSKTTGKRYFAANFTFTAKLLLFKDDSAQEGENTWTLFITEKEPKPQAPHFSGPPGDDAQTRRRTAA